MRFRKRLERLERTVLDRSCPACSHRKGLVALVCKMSDGRSEGMPPEPCSVCGQVPEKVMELEIEVVKARPPRAFPQKAPTS